MSYAIVKVGGKQYRVQEGEKLLVDRIGGDEGSTVELTALLVGGDGDPQLSPDMAVTARVVGHTLGKKIRIGKYRPKSGYRRHTGYRSKLSQIEIVTIGGAKAKPARARAKPKAEEEATEA
jgi:large subunit ribosomal protein L21